MTSSNEPHKGNVDVGDIVREWREQRLAGTPNPHADLVNAWHKVVSDHERLPTFTIDAAASPRMLTVHRITGGTLAMRIDDEGLSLATQRGSPALTWVEDLGAHVTLASANLPDITHGDAARGAELVAYSDAYLAHLQGRGDEPRWARGVRGGAMLDGNNPFDHALRAHALLLELADYAPKHPLIAYLTRR